MPLAIVLSLKLCLLFWLERRTWSSGNGQFLKHQRLVTYRGYQILSFSLCFCLENMPWYLQQWVSPWTDVERSKVRNRNLVISSLLKESERQNFISFNPARKNTESSRIYGRKGVPFRRCIVAQCFHLPFCNMTSFWGTRSNISISRYQ